MHDIKVSEALSHKKAYPKKRYDFINIFVAESRFQPKNELDESMRNEEDQCIAQIWLPLRKNPNLCFKTGMASDKRIFVEEIRKHAKEKKN